MVVTWNPNDKHEDVILNGGNLTAILSGTVRVQYVRATEDKTEGKFYYEIKFVEGRSRFHFNIVDKKKELSVGDYRERPPGSITGVLLDMDKKEAHIYLNGLLVNFLDLTDFTEALPELRLGWLTDPAISTVNFGSTPFRYPVPE